MVQFPPRHNSFGLVYAAIGCITFFKWALMTQLRSGLSVKAPMESKLGVFTD